MFGINKKTPIASDPKVENIAPAKTGEVYVMPDKYLLQLRKSGGKNLLIPIILLLALIASIGGYLLYDLATNRPPAETITTTPPQIRTEVELEAPIVPETAEEEPATTTETAVATSSQELITSTTPLTAPSLSVDSDNDGLTDVEETVFGSSPANPDTDGDGYKDGIEVLNGYNPTKPGTSRLTESPFIISMTTAFTGDNYSLLYPKEWQTSVINATKQLLLTAGSGEVIRISIRDNSGGLSPLAWYLQDHPETAVSQLRLIDNSGRQISGIFSPDGFTAYLTDTAKTKFYVFEYLTGRQTEFRYPAIFSMLIKNLQVLPEPIEPPAPAVINTSASTSDEELAGE